MSNVFMNDNQLMVVKLELVAGEAENLIGTDATIKADSLEISSYETEVDDENAKFATGDHTGDVAVMGVSRGGFNIGVKMSPYEVHYDNTGSDTIVETRFPSNVLLAMAGLGIIDSSDPTNESTDDGYTTFAPSKLDDATTASVSIFDIESGENPRAVQWALAGAMSTLKLEVAGQGKPFMLNFSPEGKATGAVDVATADIPVFDDAGALSQSPFNSLDTDITIKEVAYDGSDIGAQEVEFCVETLSLDTGVGIAEIACQKGPEGIKHKVITTRQPMFECNPQFVNLAQFNFWDGMKKGKVYRIEVSHVEASSGVPMQIVIPRAQMMTASGADSDGVKRMGYVFRPLRNIQAVEGSVENTYSITVGAKNVIQA